MSAMHFPYTGRASRIGAPGLRVRTSNLPDSTLSHVKAKGMASADWRKSTSSSDYTRKLGTRGSHSSSSAREVEMENVHNYPESSQSNSESARDYLESAHNNPKYRPKEELEWDIVLKDPPRMSAQPSISSSRFVCEGLPVRLKSARPMTVSVDGEDIALEDSFTFDIVTIDSEESSSGDDSQWTTVGVMKRVDPRTNQLRRRLSRSRDASDLPVEIQSMLKKGSDQLDKRVDQPDTERTKSQGGLDADAHWRFQSILNRLNKASAPASTTVERPTRDIDHRSSGSASSAGGWSLTGTTLVGSPATSAGGSATSTKTSFPSEGARLSHANTLYPIKETESKESAAQSPSKRLNPAAAEFRSSFDEKAFPRSPKKMTRTPLTNLFPEATQKPSMNTTDQEIDRQRGTEKPSNGPASQIAGPELAMPVPYRTVSGFPGIRPPPGFEPKDYPGNAQVFPPAPPLPLPPQYLGGLFDTYPTPTLVPPPVDLVQMQMAGMNAFGTFPGPVLPMPGPIPPPRVNLGPGISPMGPQPVPFSSPVLFGPDRKINRPPFPVTQKPRDHDPIKQQQYEQYLEWRKANEPGYHMKCKMRQAQRVVRQYQQKKQDSNPAWKSIIEKAKAAVGAAAEAAAAEKRMMQESVRAELKAKVQERSGDSAKSNENIPPPQMRTPVAKVGDRYLSKSDALQPSTDGVGNQNSGARGKEKSE